MVNIIAYRKIVLSSLPLYTHTYRYLKKTAESVEALGGVRYLLVTGREHAAGKLAAGSTHLLIVFVV